MWRPSWKYANKSFPMVDPVWIHLPHFAFPVSYGSYMPNFTILIRSAGFANFLALNKPTISKYIISTKRFNIY